MVYEMLMMFVGLGVLIIGSNLLLKGATDIALRARVSPLVVGATVVAFGTSSPELLISIRAALMGSSDFTMGNVIGSNICNLALIFGLTSVIRPMKINTDSIKVDWPVAMSATLLLYFLLLKGTIGYGEGTLFLILLLAYTLFIIDKSRKEKLKNAEKDQAVHKEVSVKGNLWLGIVFLIIGSLGLYFGSEWFVTGAKNMAWAFGISERVVGIMVLAGGTSLPEMVTSLVAAFKKETDLAIGNLIGSNIFNILFILGITGLITDIKASGTILNVDMIWMLGVTLIILPMMAFNKKMGRISGLLLLTIYVFYTYIVIG